ncbi:fusicoccadiene C-8 hydroxylase [Physcia stellaris]|nr:fusicoccadiene C-8 hydroxylase [Physcia stellaris]
MDQIASIDKLTLGAGFIRLYILGGALHRLYLSPIAGFPGPKLAALTYWYETYYDVFRKGKYVFEIEDMHRRFVRVNPHELAIRDPEYYNTLYAAAKSRKTDAYHNFGAGLNVGDAHVMTVPHDLHRRRRKPLEPFFSKQGVGVPEPMLSSLTRRFCERVDSYKGTPKVIQLNHALHAYTGDVITRICCDEYPNLIEDENFSPSWHDTFRNITRAVPILTNFPQLLIPVLIAPTALVDWLSPSYKTFRQEDATMRHHAAKAKAEKADGTDSNARTTLLRHLAHSDLPESELGETRLAREAQVLLGAGVATTSRALEYIAYHLIADKEIRFELHKELERIMADFPEKLPPLSQLEKLPYLSGVVKEGLR